MFSRSIHFLRPLKGQAAFGAYPFIFFILTGLFALQSRCDDNLLGPDSDLELSDIENIIWTLTAARENGKDVNLSIYPHFRLSYVETQFFGDDGCNWFGGSYEARNDSIFPGQIAQTLRLCIRASFSVDHLAEPYLLQINQNRLHLLSQGNRYSYKSDLTKPVAGHPISMNWQLVDSSDPDFSNIQAQGLIPTLELKDDRTFRIVWDCSQENPFECDSIAGLFGIGANGKITFYQREGAYHGEGPGENFMHRILASSTFALAPVQPKGATLVLTNADSSTFEFQSITR